MQKLTRADCENLRNEIKLHAKLVHPNIIKYYDSLQVGNTAYILLEWAANNALFFHINPRVGISEKLALRFLYETALALKYLHDQGIVHRDIKPENILLNDRFQVKLCDFGWSCLLKDEFEMRSSICGTYEYMSPEIALMSSHGPKTDIWCLGILLYEMTAGEPPFKVEDLGMLKKQFASRTIPIPSRLSPEAQDLMRGMLQIEEFNRLNIDQVLRHPVFAKYQESFKQPLSPDEYNVLAKNYYYNTNTDQPDILRQIEHLIYKGDYKDEKYVQKPAPQPSKPLKNNEPSPLAFGQSRPEPSAPVSFKKSDQVVSEVISVTRQEPNFTEKSAVDQFAQTRLPTPVNYPEVRPATRVALTYPSALSSNASKVESAPTPARIKLWEDRETPRELIRMQSDLSYKVLDQRRPEPTPNFNSSTLLDKSKNWQPAYSNEVRTVQLPKSFSAGGFQSFITATQPSSIQLTNFTSRGFAHIDDLALQTKLGAPSQELNSNPTSARGKIKIALQDYNKKEDLMNY
mgnify:CR=1 FL=1